MYFGALEQAFGAAAGTLRPGGTFAFNVEAEPDGSTERFRLHGHGRYSHGANYVQKCLESAGFTAARIESAAIRKEAGTDVRGYVVLAKKAI